MPEEATCGMVSSEEIRRRKIAEKVMEILRDEKVTRNEAYLICVAVQLAVDREATLGYCPVSGV